ncbi:putative virus X resistance protein-like, coiled-coil [Helianthus debilis subsp. tardiflorus]
MGDAAISALVADVLGKLTSELIKEFDLLWGFKNDVLSLKEDFDQIQAVLQDAEEKHSKEEAVKLWLRRLRSASLEVENVLDEISTEALLQRLHKQRGIKYRVRAFFSSDHNQLVFRARIAHKVKAMRRKLDAIASKRFELKLTPSSDISHVGADVVGEMPSRETSSLIHDFSTIFGRDKEIEKVIETICDKDIGKPENGEIRVYGIWGMGGVGKTTLAQLVYNHERVNQHFELKCWVYVSEKFQVQDIIKGIIESINEYECKLTRLDVLQKSLQNKLRGKKFLVVLDDVWIEDKEKAKWDELSKTLSCGAEESIVVMTTRSQTTSRMMAKVLTLQHEVRCLSEGDSWLLFKKLAFAQGRMGDDMSQLEPIGKEIVNKCKGLPLAVKTLGTLMWSKKSASEWQLMKDNNIWELENTKVLPAILKFSYDNLPPHLKRCFSYCCMFPKGYKLTKDALIRLWVSNGFIPPKGEINLYVLGEEVFNCLVWRSFFIVKEDEFEEDLYLIHDLMHDMAQHVMGDDCLAIEFGKEVIIPNEVLHLTSSCPGSLFCPHDLKKLTSLRSIFLYGKINEGSIKQIFNHVYLRVLYLAGIQLKTLPESICKLKHLKYLNLSRSSIQVLHESIIYLQNLQVLLLYRCKFLHKLPKGLRYMRNLEHLGTNRCYSLLHMPLGITELTNLQILPYFPVCNKSGANIGELGNLNLLKGELKISQIENVGGLSEVKNANLKCKKDLSVLELCWSILSKRESKQEMCAYDEKVLEGLEPNPGLKELKIFNYMGKAISPSWIVNLRNVVEIVFCGCKNCEHIQQLGRLPNLRVIKLEYMASLKCFHDDDKNMIGDTNMFLSLQELHISKCPNLVSLPSNLPKLKILTLRNCNGLASLPDEIQSFKDLKDLVIERCKHLCIGCEKDIGVEWPKISHIPNISINPLRPIEDGDRDDDDDEDEDIDLDEDEEEDEDDEDFRIYAL